MTEHNKAEETRKGLFDSVKGKAKEVVGAVTGNESLTAEGQLEQTQAQQRREASTAEAVADAEATQAHAEATEAKQESTQERIATNVRTAAVENSVRSQQAAQKRAAEEAGQRDADIGKTQAELEAQRDMQRAQAQERGKVGAAAAEVVDAVADHQEATQEAAGAEAEADRMRHHANQLTDEADLP